MNVDPSREAPLFIQIAEAIEDDVFTGVYREEDRILSTNEIAALFGINPHTVLKGMNILVDEGVIYKKRGLGMYVQTGALEAIRIKRQDAFFEAYVESLVKEATKLHLSKAQVVALIEKGYNHA